MFECLSTRTNDYHNILQIKDFFFLYLISYQKSEMMTSQCLIAIFLM